MNDTRSDIEAHYNTVIKAILDGRVVPFFGAGVNLCGLGCSFNRCSLCSMYRTK